MDSVDEDQPQQQIIAESSVPAMRHAATEFDRAAEDDASIVARQQAADWRERHLDRRERQSLPREAVVEGWPCLLDGPDQQLKVRADRSRHRISALAAGGINREAVIRLGALALSWQDLHDVASLTSAIVAGAVEAVPGAAYASLTVMSPRQVTSIVVADAVMARLDRVEKETGESPAITSLREHITVRVDDMAAETRWPAFAARAAQTGVGSLLALRLFVRRGELGVLTLCSRAPYAFDDDAEQIAVLFAAHAAVALAGAQKEQHLLTALSSRDAIGQAKGILTERHGLSPEQAFEVLKRASQDTNTKLVDVVKALIETGDIAPDSGSRFDG